MMHSLLYWIAMAFFVPLALCLGTLTGIGLVRIGVAIIEAITDRLP